MHLCAVDDDTTCHNNGISLSLALHKAALETDGSGGAPNVHLASIQVLCR
jgi:hypothetical protein